MLASNAPPDFSGTCTVLDRGGRIRPVPVSATESISSPCRGAIIGEVIFRTHRGERAEAILDAEGRWRCPELPVLDRVLNILFAPSRDAAGVSPFGHDALKRVATWIKGEARVYRP